MRRVNEAVRQVLSEAVAELKDPRIGFVTVTGVETSTRSAGGPRLRQRARLGAGPRPDATRGWPPRTASSRPVWAASSV